MNPTRASVLKGAGYETAAFVDNPNVAAQLGYAKGFDTYRETWQEKELRSEMDRTRAITDAGIAHLVAARPEKPFLLWLHYVNPHTPYEPPPPFDSMFAEGASEGPALRVVPGLKGGIPKQWAVPGRDRLGYYVAQYDGEIAAVDAEVGRVLDALRGSAVAGKTLVVLTSDHGESLGEHDYYFDHGENLFEPSLRVPLIAALPGAPGGRRSDVFASTLDLVPTVLDAAKVSWPPDLAGVSLLAVVEGRAAADPRGRPDALRALRPRVGPRGDERRGRRASGRATGGAPGPRAVLGALGPRVGADAPPGRGAARRSADDGRGLRRPEGHGIRSARLRVRTP
jgi:arylsulfatase A-like enzyme